MDHTSENARIANSTRAGNDWRQVPQIESIKKTKSRKPDHGGGGSCPPLSQIAPAMPV